MGTQWVEGNPIMNTDPFGFLPCDTPDGGQDRSCLSRIVGKIEELQYFGQMIGNWGLVTGEQTGGYSASHVMRHYLSGNGETLYLPHEMMSPEFHQQVADMTEAYFRGTDYFRNLCAGGCCSASTGDIQWFDSVISNERIAPTQNFSRSDRPDWVSKLPGPARDIFHTTGQGTNPYYSAFGTITVNSTEDTGSIVREANGSSVTIDVSTPVEYYDYYDWCYGEPDNPNACNAAGTHPYGMRVGHFIAIEEGGFASPFNWYSYADVRVRLSIECAGSVPTVTGRRVWAEFIPRPNSPIRQPVSVPFVTRDSGIFIDDWPSESQARQCFNDYLFPDDPTEMDHTGMITCSR